MRLTLRTGSLTMLGSLAMLMAGLVLEPVSAQYLQQGSKLVGSGAVGGAQQGVAVALAADGNTALIGGLRDDNTKGAAWVFTRSKGVWSQEGAKLVGGGIVGSAGFEGIQVALSADGNTALIGGTGDNGNAGAAWVFVRTNGMAGATWTQQGPKLVGSGAIGNAFQGFRVALSADGNTAIVGGNSDNNSVGAAWIFARSGGVWSQQAKLVGGGGLGQPAQGWSVALSADGNTALVGGAYDNNNVGAAWVFTRSGSIWSQQGNKLVGSGATGKAQQGWSVALSGDGNTALVHGPADNNWTGAAWIFTRSNGAWTQQGDKLVGSGLTATPHMVSQGHAAALSSDGNIAVIGGASDNNSAGATFVFTRANEANGATWTQSGALLTGSGAVGSAWQGYSVGLSSDGTTLIEGGPVDNNNTGAAWVFAANPQVPSNAVVNAASFRGGAVAPGEMVTIFGTGIGPATFAGYQVADGMVSSNVAGTQFLFDGVPAPIIYTSSTQSTVMVPYAVAGKTSTQLQVRSQDVLSIPTTLAVATAAPGLFTLSQDGSGAGAIVNQDGSINSSGKPAAKGSVVLIYLTGDGQTTPEGVDGQLALSTFPKTAAPVSVRIGDRDATVIYAGVAPQSVAGFTQLNVKVPSDAPSGDAVPVVVTVGTAPAQPGVTQPGVTQSGVTMAIR